MSDGADRSNELADLEREREELRQAAQQALAAERWSNWRPWVDVLLLVVFIGLMTVLFAPPGQRVHPVPPVDKVAATEIRAERDVLVADRRATALRRDEAAAAVLPIFDFDSELYFNLGDRVAGAVSGLKQRLGDSGLTFDQRRAAFEEELGLSVDGSIFSLIEKLAEPTDLAIAINFFLNIALDRMVVEDRAALPRRGGIEIRDLALGGQTRLYQLGAILDLRQVRRLMSARAGDAPYGSARVVRSWILESAIRLARANLRGNEAETQAQRDAAVAGIEPVFVRIEAGEVLVRRGDRVTPRIQERIRMLNESAGGRAQWAETVAVAVLLTGVVVLAGVFFQRGRVPQKLSRKSVYLTFCIVLVSAAIAVAMFYAGRGLAEGLGFGRDTAAYFVPLALATALVSVLIDARTSLLVGIGLTLLVAYRVDGDLWLITYYIVGVLVAGIATRGCRRRSDLLRPGLAVAAAQAAVVPVTIVLGGEMFGPEHIPYLVAAGVSGALVAICVLGLLPLLEFLFDESTDLRLLELASADSPLLKSLALHAPGSYYASVIVGNLCEAAADAVGGNGLRARVMALYHDIGKMSRSSYFAENQRDGNVHDRLSPEISTRIVFSHVKAGIEVAAKARLGQAVTEAITQHHGTTLLRPFYAKALERAQRTGETVHEETFRYPGPKPKSREAGILLLADSVEAATRALKDTAPASVRKRVGDVIEEKIADGQLDECELTIRDLSAVEAAFVRVLTLGVFHTRIEYPTLQRVEDAKDKETRAGRHLDNLRRLADRSS